MCSDSDTHKVSKSKISYSKSHRSNRSNVRKSHGNESERMKIWSDSFTSCPHL